MNLVIQGPGARQSDLGELVAMCRAEVKPFGRGAFRIRNAFQDPAIPQWCQARRLDHAWVPAGRKLAGLKLLALDMDSTLITIECIDELGSFFNKKAEIAAITAQAMRGEIDYPQSLRRRVALLAGLDEDALEEVYDEKLRLSPGAETLIEECKRHGIQLLLVSGGFTFFTERLKARLGLDDTLSNLLDIENGKLTGKVLGTIVDADEKAAKFTALAQRLGATTDQTVAIGDGANDLKMMAVAGTSIAYRAKPLVKAKATHALDFSGLDGVLNLFE
jgi:phosphoserine phosphatase